MKSARQTFGKQIDDLLSKGARSIMSRGATRVFLKEAEGSRAFRRKPPEVKLSEGSRQR
jgi:hypothetical protein